MSFFFRHPVDITEVVSATVGTAQPLLDVVVPADRERVGKADDIDSVGFPIEDGHLIGAECDLCHGIRGCPKLFVSFVLGSV